MLNKRGVLIVDDEVKIVRALSDFLHVNDFTIFTARDGEEAVAILQQNVEEGPHCLPALILLDLNLPKKNGREVLAEIKKDPALKRIPVVVFSGRLQL